MKKIWLILFICSYLLLTPADAESRTNGPNQATPIPNTSSFELLTGSTNTSALREKADALYQAGDYREAKKLFSELLITDPNDSHTAWQLGYCCYSLEDYAGAVRAYAQYTALRPRTGAGHKWLGTALSRLGKFDEAQRELNTAIQLKPKYPEAYEELGYAFELRDNDLQAAIAFDKAIEFGGETAYRCERSGLAHAHLREYQRAIPLLRRALEWEPTNVTAAEWLGSSQFHLSQFEPAIATFTNALTFSPTNLFLLEWTAHAHLRLKNYSEAAAFFGRAADLDPDDFATRRSQAYAFISAHRLGEAVKALEKGVEQKPSDHHRRYSLFAAYLMNNNYKKASSLYPRAFIGATVALALVFLAGFIWMLRKSFIPSVTDHPRLLFSIGWFVLFLESQTALALLAGLFTSAKLVAGMLLAPIPMLIAAFGAFPKQPWGQPFKPAAISRKLIGFAALGWILMIISVGIYSLVLHSFRHAQLEPRNIQFVFALLREHRALAFVVVVLLAPLTEEILFRGLLFGSLSKWFKPLWTILITAILFAAVHGDLLFFFPLFLIGVLLGWARHVSQAIWLPMCIHMFQNAVALSLWLARP